MSEILKIRQLSGSSFSENRKWIETALTAKENVPPKICENSSPVKRKICIKDEKLETSTPKKSRENLEEPVTPSSNFKLLTSLAASLDYADCDTPKSSKINETLENQVSCDSDILDISGSKVNRKEKSLGIICTRFLAMLPMYPKADEKITVSLDEASVQLCVGRRRLYDIVNVFESVDILTKIGKNQYRWFGKNHLLHSLCKLKAAALKENLLEKLQYVIKLECFPSCKQSCILNEVQNFNRSLESPDSPVLTTEKSSLEARKEKSLGIMSQRFLMLFLVSPNKIISLGVAAKMLNGFLHKQDKGAQVKTQVRRLYDIANVLSSIGLIQKEAALSQCGRKPAFKYIGPDLTDLKAKLPNMDKPVSQLAVKTEKPGFVRHSSFQDICAVAEIEHQKLNLEESYNSAPPFESALLDKKELIKTNFENLQLNQSNNIKININSNVMETKPLVKTQYIVKPNLKFINLASPSNHYIINSVPAEKSDSKLINTNNSTQRYLFINTIAPTKEVKTGTENKASNKPASPQTITLSSQQRDAILQSLNISLSPEQVAAIHLDGAIQPKNSDTPLNVLKIINKNKNLNSTTNIVRLSVQKDVELNTNGSNGDNTRSNSSNSIQQLDSPLSIPSGYVTPIPNVSSDISFVSNIEVNDILKKIESQSSSDGLGKASTYHEENKICSQIIKNSRAEVAEYACTSLQNTDAKEREIGVASSINNNNETHSNQIAQLISNDSCSSDSINLEVSNIFNGKDVGNSRIKHKPFLIDEKTLLSPIKPMSPFPLNIITPPYMTPETIFVFGEPPVSYNASNVSAIANLVKSVPKLLQPDCKKKV